MVVAVWVYKSGCSGQAEKTILTIVTCYIWSKLVTQGGLLNYIFLGFHHDF